MKSRAVFFISPDCHYLSEIPKDKKNKSSGGESHTESSRAWFHIHARTRIYSHMTTKFQVPAEVRHSYPCMNKNILTHDYEILNSNGKFQVPVEVRQLWHLDGLRKNKKHKNKTREKKRNLFNLGQCKKRLHSEPSEREARTRCERPLKKNSLRSPKPKGRPWTCVTSY